MKHSELLGEIAGALAKAQGELQNVVKDATNPHFKSDYATLDAVTDTVRPVFAKYGLAIVQIPTSENGVATVHTLIAHASGQWIQGETSCPLSKADAQGLGSATTYLRRYATSAAANIAQTDDDGQAASATTTKSAPKSKPATVTEDQATVLRDIAREHGWKAEDSIALLKGYGASRLSQLPASKFEAFKAALEAKAIPVTAGQ